MDTMRAPVEAWSVETVERRNRGQTIAIVILTVIALGLSGWLAFELFAAEETAVSSDVQEVIDDYHAAWNAYDREAFLDLVTLDYRLYIGAGGSGLMAEETSLMISEGADDPGKPMVEVVGSGQMVGDATEVYVSVVNRITIAGDIDSEGIGVFALVKQGDIWKVRSHIFEGF